MVALNESFTPANPVRSPKNRVGNFFRQEGDLRPANRLAASQLRRGNGHGYGRTASGMFYYGFRYYDPETGRWLSRDPIREAGGLILYGFVGNDGVNMWDLLGSNPLASFAYDCAKSIISDFSLRRRKISSNARKYVIKLIMKS